MTSDVNTPKQVAGTEAERSGSTSSAPRWKVRPAYLFPVIALLLWAAVVPFLPSAKVPTPVAVFSYMWEELRGDTVAPDSVYYNFGVSLLRLIIGASISMALGVVVGVASGLSRRLDAFFRDFVIGSLTIPGLIVALVTALWFGFGFLTPVVTVVITTFAYTASNLAEGVRDVPRDLVFMARSFRMSRSALFRHVVAPSLTPFMLVSLRYVLSLGWKALTIAEIFGASDGAGWMLRFWYDANRVQSLVGYAFFFAVVTVLLDRVFFELLARRLLRWRGDVSAVIRR